ncbi:MAG: SDR family NAD(P)-dependent oxidoreductase [Planctomycetota bacterium]|nr:SDR family NAD(P)-dependent oxidoreductase [Planctomycetota bacterium]
MDLQGAVAIVTGGSAGYGLGIAHALVNAGAHVWITGRDVKALEAAASSTGGKSFRADVTKPKDWDRLFARVMKVHGRVDLLVNNAGSGVLIAPMAEQTDDAIAASIAANLTGAMLGCRRAATVMAKQKSGTIINISSVCAEHAWPGWGPYSAAKAGMNQFGRCLYAELRPAGVRVTTLTPSWGATDFVKAAKIKGHPAGDPKVAAKCMTGAEMGDLVVSICRTPDHLVMLEVRVQPTVQEIMPL